MNALYFFCDINIVYTYNNGEELTFAVNAFILSIWLIEEPERGRKDEKYLAKNISSSARSDYRGNNITCLSESVSGG